MDWGCLDFKGINDAVCDHNDMVAWAYVVWLQPPGPAPGSNSPDIDCDGIVGIQDFLALLAAWGPCAGACVADLDCDGTVGILDFLALLAQWG